MMLRWPGWPGPAPGAPGGRREACIWGARKDLAKSIILMFEMRTDSRSTSVTSLYLPLAHTIVICMAESNDSWDFYAWAACSQKLLSNVWLRAAWLIAPVDCARELRLGNTGDVRVTLGVPPKFLVVLRACPGPTGPAIVAPGLRHRHNGPGSPGPLTGPLEGYPELPMFFC